MKFDPEIALSYARAISRPRLVGSVGEREAADQIAGWLKGFGFRVEREQFRFTRAFDWFLAGEVALGLLLVLLTLALRETIPGAAAVTAVALALLILASGRINRAAQLHAVAPEAGAAVSPFAKFCLGLGRLYSTANLVATWPGEDDRSRPHLYLVAHYDSKSQRLSLPIRVALFAIAAGGSLAFAALALLGFALPALIPVAAAAGAAVVLAGLPLIFLGTGNRSPGAIDNGSGVGVAVHLAEILSSAMAAGDKPGVGITMLVTAAEELATMGAVAFVLRQREALRGRAETGGLHILNFDGVGVEGKPYLTGAGKSFPSAGKARPVLADLVRQSCRDLGIALGTLPPIGLLVDHLPFAQAGLDAVSLVAIGRATWAVHTSADSPDRLHVRGFEQAGRVALEVADRLARAR